MHVPASMGRVLDVCSVCGKMSKWHLCLTASHSLRLAELQASDQGKGGAPNFKAIAFKRAALSIRDYPVPVASGRDAESMPKKAKAAGGAVGGCGGGAEKKAAGGSAGESAQKKAKTPAASPAASSAPAARPAKAAKVTATEGGMGENSRINLSVVMSVLGEDGGSLLAQVLAPYLTLQQLWCFGLVNKCNFRIFHGNLRELLLGCCDVKDPGR